MTGNVALDVVIGLVFIYLLYSLYATIIMEILSSYFGLRARNLRYALRRMLMDEEKNNSLTRTVNSLISFTGKASNLKNPELFERFFQQPSIKYLGSGGVNSKPSYLSAETFSKTIIDAIAIHDDPDFSVLSRIEGGLKKLHDEKESTSPISTPSDTTYHIQSLLDNANNDLSKFKLLLEDWFNETMDRATGWFKKTTQVFLAIIGFVLAVTFHVDTIEIIQKLSKDPDAREQLVKLATDFTQKNQELIDAAKRDPAFAGSALKERLDSLESVKGTLEKDIRASQQILVTTDDDGSFLGYLLTALAISLGAPFWFDLLNKLVKLRSSKAVDTEPSASGGSGTSGSKRATLNRAG